MKQEQLEKANQIISACSGFWRIGMNNVIKEFLEFKRQMDSINESFFLTGGTCLGIKRDGALIEWDRDIDIGIMNDESLYRIEEKLSKYYDEIKIEKYNERGRSGYHGKQMWLKKFFGELILPIEVMVHYTEGNNVYWNRSMGKTFKKKNWNGHGRAVWPKKLFDKFEKIEFAGEYFNIPSPAEEFLTILYGNDWRTPKIYKDWRYNCYNLLPGWK